MLRRKFMSLALAGVIGITSIFSVGCGGFIASLKTAIASSGPLLSVLVNKKVLSQEKADFIRSDFNAAVDVVAELDKDFKAATNTGDKLAAAQKAERAWKAIYAQGHFGANATILEVANIVDAVFASVVAYYGGGPRASLTSRSGARIDSEEALAQHVKERAERIKELLKVK